MNDEYNEEEYETRIDEEEKNNWEETYWDLYDDHDLL